MSDPIYEPASFAEFLPLAGDRVSPDVQMQRDKVRLALLQQEQIDNPNDAFLPRVIADTTRKIEGGDPFAVPGEPANRGSKIAGELKARKVSYEPMAPAGAAAAGNGVRYEPMFPEEKAPPTTKQGEIGMLDAAGRGTVHGLMGLAEAVNTGVQFIGNRVGATGMAGLGESGSEYWRNKATPYEAPPELQGAIIENPALLAKGAWWTYNMADMAPSFAAAIIPGVGTARAIGVAGKALKLTPEVIQRLAILGGSIAGGTAGGSLEGAQTYQEVLKRGAPEPEAAVAGSTMALASAALNAISVGTIIKPGKMGAVLRFLTTGATEGVTEWLEEPAEGAILGQTSVAKPEDDPIERAKQGLNVLPIAALAGGGAGMMTGGQRKPQEPTPAPVAPAEPQAAAPQPAAPPAPVAPPETPVEAGPPAVAGQDLPLLYPGSPTYDTGAGIPPPGGPGGGPDTPSTYNSIDSDGNRYRPFVSGGVAYDGELYSPFHPDRLYAPDTQPDANLQPIVPRGTIAPIDQARVDAQTIKAGFDLGLPAGDQRLINAQLVNIYGENAAVRHVIEAPDQFGSIARAMMLVAPAVQRVRKTTANNERSRDVTNDILGAVDAIARIRKEGGSVAETIAQGVSHDLSYEGQQLAQFLDENADNPAEIAGFIERYLHEVEQATGVPSEVRGRAFDIIQERRAAQEREDLKRAAEVKKQAAVRAEGAAKKEKSATSLAARIEATDQRVLTELAVAKAAGSGINPGHLTAIELAFQNALKKRGEKDGNVKGRGGVQGGPEGGAGPRAGQGQAGGNQRQVPKPGKPADEGNARPVRAEGNQKGAEPGVVDEGAQKTRIDRIKAEVAKPNPEPQSSKPVAESQAPATSEPGNAGIAPGQAAALPEPKPAGSDAVIARPPQQVTKTAESALSVLDIPKGLRISLPVFVEDIGQRVYIEQDAKRAFKEAGMRVNRLQSLINCLRA